MIPACQCRFYCGDVPEEDDFNSICKSLPRPPEPPMIEIVLVHRNDPMFEPAAGRDRVASEA